METSGSARGVSCFTSVHPGELREHVQAERFFWLDLTEPSDDQIEALGGLFGFHPLAVEDAREFHQRPKLDLYGDHVFLVVYGAAVLDGGGDGIELNEVHIFISGNFVITMHQRAIPELEELRARIEGKHVRSEQFLVYRVIDALTDTFFPVLTDIDEQIDELQDAVIERADEAHLQRIFSLKRELLALRRVVTPQRDLFARNIDELRDLPGLDADEHEYFRDVYDHLIRISDLVDSYRDLLGGATDLYLSTVANRQGEVSKQLTIIATIFLPLTFLTGFFGQNFSYLVGDVLNSELAFYGLGLGSLVCSCVAFLVFFRRKGWL